MSSEETLSNCNSKMKKALEVFNHELGPFIISIFFVI